MKELQKYPDLIFNREALCKRIYAESDRQIKKWGIQNRTLQEWVMFTTEELGELAQAIGEFIYRDGSPVNIEKEAIQVATLAIKIASIANLDKKIKELWPNE